MLMQKFGVTNKEHYGMFWYFLVFSGVVNWGRTHGLCVSAEIFFFRVFIAQLVEHCSANLEAMGSNPVDSAPAPNFFSVKFALA